MINQPVPGFRVLDFIKPAPFPFARVGNNAGPDHIQIDINNASPQIVTGFYRCGMITVFLKSAFTILAAIVFLAKSAGNELNRSGDGVFLG